VAETPQRNSEGEQDIFVIINQQNISHESSCGGCINTVERSRTHAIAKPMPQMAKMAQHQRCS
jgi:hypothetical protein